jgi:hypothetical protein
MKERSKEINKKQQSPKFQSRPHRRFLPLMGDIFYNCEFCGIGIAVIKIDTAVNDVQFKVCGSCLKEYIDQQSAKK